MTDDLPNGWARASVAELSSLVQYGSSAKTTETASGVPVLRMGNIVGGRLVLDNLKYLPKTHAEFPALLLQPGDVLFNRTNSPELVGKTAVYTADHPSPCSFASYLIRLQLRVYEPTLIAAYLNSGYGRAWVRSCVSQQVGQANVSGGKLKELDLPVPPVNEQRRIVAKLEALQARSRRAREALDAVPPLLEKLRQSVLAAAFRGDLTKDWRAQNPNPEPASALLARIRTERRKKWEESELAKFKAKGKAPTDDRWKAKYKEPEPVDTTGLPELPDGWCWVPLGHLGADPVNAVQTGPFGAQLHNTEFVSNGVPVIAVGNLTGVGFRRDGVYFVTPNKAKQLERFDVQAGDVLFARSGATTGKVCVAPAFVKDWRMTGHILRLRLNLTLLLPEIAVFALAGAPFVKRQISGNIRGATRPGYNTALLESICVPVPPIDEQRAIASSVAEVLDVLDARNAASDDLLAQLSKLEATTLAKAFRGELVPQDPNDEPADAMLARLRNDAPAESARRRPRRAKAAE